jgi:hypothetical protein
MDIHLNDHVPHVKPCCYKELETLYGVSRKTLKTWLKPFWKDIGQKQGRYFTIKQVKVIFDKLGLPDSLAIE